jgi:subtilisin family serine protease
LFDKAGNRLANPIIRQKPEIVAPDGVNTTFFEEHVFDVTTPCGTTEPYPNFFGTSAAVPHAAAVAALMLHANPGLKPAQIYSNPETTAIDMLKPGFDYGSGFGLIQANRAVRAQFP